MIKHNAIDICDKVIVEVLDVLSSNWLSEGVKVREFEIILAQKFGVLHSCAIAVSSGSAALYLSLMAMNA